MQAFLYLCWEGTIYFPILLSQELVWLLVHPSPLRNLLHRPAHHGVVLRLPRLCISPNLPGHLPLVSVHHSIAEIKKEGLAFLTNSKHDAYFGNNWEFLFQSLLLNTITL